MMSSVATKKHLARCKERGLLTPNEQRLTKDDAVLARRATVIFQSVALEFARAVKLHYVHFALPGRNYLVAENISGERSLAT